MLVGVVGTRITDAMTGGLNIGRYTSTTALAIILAAVFATWYRRERTRSVHPINTSLLVFAAIAILVAVVSFAPNGIERRAQLALEP